MAEETSGTDTGGHSETTPMIGSFEAAQTEFAALGIPQDLATTLRAQLTELLQVETDTPRVLSNLCRFLHSSRSALSWSGLFEREPEALHTLIRLFSTSQYMSNTLIADPDVFDLVRLTEGRPVDAEVLKDEINAEVLACLDLPSAMRVLRTYRHRETLRIAYGDFINGQPLETVTEQISILAESIVQAALAAAEQEVSKKRPVPTQPDGSPVRFCVIALGKLGGKELNYSSDIDLIFIRDSLQPSPVWESTETTPHTVDEYFQKFGQVLVRVLSESTTAGIAYRVDMRLRPHGKNGKLVISLRDALGYYDSFGRTWERQAFIKARPIAGFIDLGEELIAELQPWIYRRYLMRADITGIAALKRRIEHRAKRAGDADKNIKLGHGGIRDIEYVIQFLQLLHGGDYPDVRCVSTLEAIGRLQEAGCITAEEQSILDDNYRYLRRIEHHLQIMFDRQTHELPVEKAELQRVASKVEPSDQGQSQAALDSFQSQLQLRTKRNRQILDHLLHDAFAAYSPDDAGNLAHPESDLILDPEPEKEAIDSTLQPYGFRDTQSAYRHLQELASETISFLSTRRSRHFLAAIAPKLLQSISRMPDPDGTLINLANVSNSLGGKAVLWELFSTNPPSMELCVRLCATSPYLCSILTSNPGMLDELLDSLMHSSLPSHTEMSESLQELCRGAVDIAPILHSFKNSMHLRVGVRDILGKNSIANTHAALSDIAEVCMEQIIHNEFHRLVQQLGMPVVQTDEAQTPGQEHTAELVVLAVGKLGGREPNYHSDLDIIFLFDGEGKTRSLVPSRRFESTTNRHFFNQLCQRVIHATTQIGGGGKLYDVDVRLRPLGRSGQLAITFDDLESYFRDGIGQVWERQALCKARPIWGSPVAQQQAMQRISNVLSQETQDFTSAAVQEMYDHRLQLQQGASQFNLKRGIGGTMDVEFIAQLLQLECARTNPSVLVPGTLEALKRLEAAGALKPDDAGTLRKNYEFLRSIESGIRLMDLSARHELPTDEDQLQRLSFLLRVEKRYSIEPQALVAECDRVMQENRSIFERVFSERLPDQT